MKEKTEHYEIKTHIVNEDDRQPEIATGGRVAPGNACQIYDLSYPYVHPEPYEFDQTGFEGVTLEFVTLENGGVTNEALLAIVIDRLEGYQSGPFACEENALALESAKASLEYLKMRTKDRQKRGVENTHQS